MPVSNLEEARRSLSPFTYLRLPGADALHQALGLVDAGGGARAVRRLKKVIADYPRLAPAYLFLGLALAETGNRKAAVAVFDTALDMAFDAVAEISLIGDSLLAWGIPEKAAEAYRQAVMRTPHSAEAYWRLGRADSRLGDTTAALRNLEKATLLQPNFAPAHADLGHEYRATNLPDAAISSYRRTLELDPDNEEVKLALDAAVAAMVPQWHFAKLNDNRRNRAFDGALRKAVKRGAHVLDIGTGTGVLAMMAVRAGAARVTACESVSALAEVAERIVAANGFADRIHIVNRKSTELDIGRDMPEPADLLVAEIVDSGLLSEGVIGTFDHARNNLLKPRAPIIPRGGTLYAMPIECFEIDGERRVGKSAGFDVSPLNTLVPRVYLQTDLSHYEWRGLARAVRVFDFDFAGGQLPETERLINIKPAEDGICHAIAVWFRLRLDDKIVIATGPHHPPTHWKQAVYAASPPRRLVKGKPVTLHARHNRNTVFLDLVS